MSLYVVLMNILFSAVLADFSDSGPLQKGFVSSRVPMARHHAHRRHRNNYHVDEWVLRHSYSDSSDEPGKHHDSSMENDENLGTFENFRISLPIGDLDDSQNVVRKSRGMNRFRRHRHRNDDFEKNSRKRSVDTDESERYEGMPIELADKHLEKYKEQSVCKYTVENVANSSLKHIKCKQPGKITSNSKDQRYCVQTYTYTEFGCENDIKLYTGCMYVVRKFPKQEGRIPTDD